MRNVADDNALAIHSDDNSTTIKVSRSVISDFGKIQNERLGPTKGHLIGAGDAVVKGV